MIRSSPHQWCHRMKPAGPWHSDSALNPFKSFIWLINSLLVPPTSLTESYGVALLNVSRLLVYQVESHSNPSCPADYTSNIISQSTLWVFEDCTTALRPHINSFHYHAESNRHKHMQPHKYLQESAVWAQQRIQVWTEPKTTSYSVCPISNTPSLQIRH